MTVNRYRFDARWCVVVGEQRAHNKLICEMHAQIHLEPSRLVSLRFYLAVFTP